MKKKVALLLHGLVGSMEGKHYQNKGGADTVLQHSYDHNKEFILDQYNTDVFIHSWNVDLKDQIQQLYNPKWMYLERQVQFKIPEYIRAKKDRIFAHLSRWYSFKQVAKKAYEVSQTQGSYDFYLIQRFDLVWNTVPDFPTRMPGTVIWVGNSTLNRNVEWSDRWFAFTDPQSLQAFSTLYDDIPKYMGPTGDFQSDKQYGGISSHFLTKHHAQQVQLYPEFKYNFGGYGQKPNDYNEVRRQYGKDDN